MGRIVGKIALVTGAGSGIGKGIAKVLAKEGAKVIVADLNPKGGEEVVEEIRKAGGKACFLSLNVAKEDEWKKTMAAIKEHDGRLDIVVNNAGIAFDGTIESTSLEEWRRVQSINLDGVFLGTKYAVELMRELNGGEGGSIVNMCSSSALVGIPNLAAYGSSKGGVKMLTKSAALHCARNGYKIRINSVCPGYIQTPLVDELTRTDKAAYQHLVDIHPVGHLGTPEDVAYGVLYLASDESKFVTATELVIDGGYTAE